MTEAMLGKIEQAIERILDNSRSIDSYHYYLESPAGMERLESTCMLLMAIGEGLKGIDKLTDKQLSPNIRKLTGKVQWECEIL